MAKQISVACIGFGEAGQAFCRGWLDAGASIRVFDIKTDEGGDIADGKWSDYADFAVEGQATIGGAVADAEVVFSLVTADRAHSAALAAADVISSGALFLDCNSCSPQTKQKSSRVIEASGARYVDVAIMAPVAPKKHKTPLLVSGPEHDAALQVLEDLAMSAEEAGENIGAASSTKLVRSIMVKGLEALTLECFTAGRLLGVEETVLETFEKSYPGFGWREKSAYNFDRVMVHGVRRAAEMRESAAMLEEAGLPNRMAKATADWQAEVGCLGLEPGEENMQTRADTVLRAIGKSPKA